MEENQFLTNALDALNHPFYVIDANDYTVKMANAAAYKGKLPDKITCHLLIHGESTPCHEHGLHCSLQEVKMTGQPIVVEHIHRDENGVERAFEVHGHPVFNEEGKVTHIIEYALDITERKREENEKQAILHQLDERVKELNCLYGISRLVTTPGITPDEILQGTVDLIPPSWQYPEITCARVVLGFREYRTDNYRQSPWKQKALIIIDGDIGGFVEVAYLSEMPTIDEGPFLKEERNLIDAIAERLGRIIERAKVEERVHQNEMQLAAIKERERIGRELHDDLGQVMSYFNAQAQAALVRLGEDEVEEAGAILAQLAKIARESSDEIREYILGIRTASAQPKTDFFSALARYQEALHDRYGLATQVSLPDEWQESPFAPEVESQLLHIIREALTNVHKHAGVNRARLIFTEHPDEVQVIIEDDGHGFELKEPTRVSYEGSDGHFGLAIMGERAAAANGRFEIRSSPGEGTRVIVCLPRTISQKVKPSSEDERGVRVLLADDHPLYLEGLSSLLAARGMQVVGQAHDGLGAQQMARDLRPDLILMDMNMPRCDGLEATRRIKAELPEIKIVILTVSADEKKLFEALKSGASGYLLKSLDRTQFFTLLGEVLSGETALSPNLASRVLTEMVGKESDLLPQGTDEPALTARQVEVLEHIARGMTNKEIAASLHISERTVKYHVGQILERLHMKSRYELSHYAHQSGHFFQSD